MGTVWQFSSKPLPSPKLSYLILKSNGIDLDLLTNAMVTYSLRRVWGGRTATFIPLTVRRPYSFYGSRMLTSRILLATRSSQTLLFLYLDIKLFQNPRRRCQAASAQQGSRAVTGLAMGMRWQRVFTGFSPFRGCLENRTAAVRWLHGHRKIFSKSYDHRTASMRWPYDTFDIVQPLYGHITVAVRFLTTQDRV